MKRLEEMKMNNKNKNNKDTKKGLNSLEEKAPGYGDKKLEGPNRPAE
jgi:hypothetical protein